jgi:hypothetical protein
MNLISMFGMNDSFSQRRMAQPEVRIDKSPYPSSAFKNSYPCRMNASWRGRNVDGPHSGINRSTSSVVLVLPNNIATYPLTIA